MPSKKKEKTTNEDIDIIKTTMLTKDYLDKSIAAFRKDLRVLTKTNGPKLKNFIETQYKNKKISLKEKKYLLSV